MSENLYEFLFPAGRDPARIVLTADDGSRWTRSALSELAGRMAAALQDAGVRPGDRVAVQVEKSPSAVCLYLACLVSGAVFLPLNTAYTIAEVGHVLADAKPSAYVGRPAMVSAIEAAGTPVGLALIDLDDAGGGTLLELAQRAPLPAQVVPRAADDLAAILYTSGTTGRPKGAMITHGNLAFAAGSLVEVWRIDEDDVLLHALPIFHAHGLFIAINSMLRAGATIEFLSRFTVDVVVEALPRATVFMGVPTFYTRLLAEERVDRDVCRRIRLFTSGSAPLSAATFEAFKGRTGHAILERYGMTETTIIATNPLLGDRLAGSVGYPLPGVQVEVRDRGMTALPFGEVGELVVRGPNVFKGYWEMPEKTKAEQTPDGFFRTGDLAWIAPDGRITIAGREKDLIITGGYNVYPQEIEAALNRIDGVRDSAVVGVPHPDFGEGVVAVLEMKPGDVRPAPDTVITHLANGLARFKLPKFIFFMDEMPRNALGKVQKNLLREAYRDTFCVAEDA